MAADRSWPRTLGYFVIALILGSVLGSLIQTQFNLLSIQSLGADIGFGLRVQTSLQDLWNFGPVYALLFGLSFLLSQAAALALGRLTPRIGWPPLFALAAAVGLWVTFQLVNALAPMPTLIAATRSPFGLMAMLASALMAGWVFGRLLCGPLPRRSGAGSTPVAAALLLSAGLALPEHSAQAQPEGPDYRIETVVEGLEHPWSLAFLPDGRMLVTERPGRLRLISAEGELQSEPLEGLPSVFASGQAGLMDILLAPNFEDNGLLYLSYSCGSKRANHTCLLRATLADGELQDVEEVFRTQPAKTGDAHYGGRMAWLPDHTLILTMGDGFDYREQAQNPRNHIGKIVRLNPDGSPPNDNPFAGAEGISPEIYSLGHRNPQGLIYDDEGHRLISHEHGPKGGDEINIIRAGHNYGWPLVTRGLDYTGARITPFTEMEGMTPPAKNWTPSIAPSGMTLYTGDQFPQWQGSLLVGALAARQVNRVDIDAQPVTEEVLFAELGERIRDVRTGPEGYIYLLTDEPDGQLLRVKPDSE